jgi:hypothetical protein
MEIKTYMPIRAGMIECAERSGAWVLLPDYEELEGRLETLRLKIIKRLGATKDEDGMWIDGDGEYVDELNADEKFIIPAKSNETL